MKKKDYSKKVSTKCICFLYLIICLLNSLGLSQQTQINYEAQQLGGNRWSYTYEVCNINLPQGIEEFTIWFDFGLYNNLAIETSDILADNWNEIIWQPNSVIGDAGGYDALGVGFNIGAGGSISGFAVSFDWNGTSVPGSQFYQIIDPLTFETIESGYTIPEPMTCMLLLSGALLLRQKAKTNLKF